MTKSTAAALLAGLLVLLACVPEEGPRRETWSADADEHGHSAPTPATVRANAEVADALPLADVQDLEDARRGLLASEPEVVIPGPGGITVWDTRSYGFVSGDAPASVNPSLWRQEQLNGIHGLFEVTDGIWQVRGYDLSNLTVIEGETGWILVDPLTSAETASAALGLARKHLGANPIRAVIFTHSHIDHFGGVTGVLPEDPAERDAVRVIAPQGFMHEATSENVLAGPAMLRRASLMYGMPLARTARGHVGTGLGKQPARGTVGIVAPTDVVDRTPQEMTLDGVRFVFQFAPESEAPAELTFYLPDKKAFCGAEIISRNMHNLYTLRGAKVRDALRWSGYIEEARQLFAGADIAFNSHHWPVWGAERVDDYLRKQRDVYKYIHDQTMRLANAGLTPREIAHRLELPESLRPVFANRGYYGTVRHNAKAVYQHYFGWYDGNPTHLDPLPPEESAARYVALMGGAEKVREHAQRAFDDGEYRWAATLLDHVVFASPDDVQARELLARSYDQLGYQAESGPWRDVYLTGAYELRHGVPQGSALSGAIGLLRATPLERFFDAMAARLDGPAADGQDTTVHFVFTDRGESHVLWIENAVLHHRRGQPESEPDATVNLTHDFFLRLVLRQVGLRDLIFSDDLAVDGSRTALLRFFSLLEAPAEHFPIVTP